MSATPPELLDGAVKSLRFEPWDPLNARLNDEQGARCYTVSTNLHAKKRLTVIRSSDTNRHELASLEWRSLFSDRISLRGGESTSISKFLDGRTFTGSDGKKYKWVKKTFPGFSLEVCYGGTGHSCAWTRFVCSLFHAHAGAMSARLMMLTCPTIPAAMSGKQHSNCHCTIQD